MKKKFFAVLVMVCAYFISTVQPVLADGAPRLSASADAAKADQGQTVKVKVNLSNNPKISTFGMSLSYDADAFEYRDCSWSSSIGGNNMKMASDADGSVSLSLVCDENYGADGTVATLSFRAKKDNAAVDMNISLREMTDKNLDDVTSCKVSKTVGVPKAAEKNGAEKNASEKTEKREAETSKETTGVKTTAQKSKEETKVKSAAVSKTTSASSGTDESYKTGVLAGEDVLFVIAAVCGLAAFAVWNERRKGTWS